MEAYFTMTDIPMEEYDRDSIFFFASEFGIDCIKKIPVNSRSKTCMFIIVSDKLQDTQVEQDTQDTQVEQVEQDTKISKKIQTYTIEVYIGEKNYIIEIAELNKFSKYEIDSYLDNHKKWKKINCICIKDSVPHLYLHVDSNDRVSRMGVKGIIITDKAEDVKKTIRSDVKKYQDEINTNFKEKEIKFFVNSQNKEWKKIPVNKTNKK